MKELKKDGLQPYILDRIKGKFLIIEIISYAYCLESGQALFWRSSRLLRNLSISNRKFLMRRWVEWAVCFLPQENSTLITECEDMKVI
jgi:hypothetical protein